MLISILRYINIYATFIAMKLQRILNVSYSDYSNFSYNMARAINTAGGYCDAVTLKAHPFGYDNQATLIQRENIKELSRKYDVIQIMHSKIELLQLVDLSAKLTVWHTGSPYRFNKQLMNHTFNPIVKKSFYDSSEFHNTGMANEAYIFGCLSALEFDITYTKGRPFMYAHYPSSAEVKGTAVINEIMQELQLSYMHSVNTVPHAEQLNRMKLCDIYVELFSPILKGHTYGSFGMTAIEAGMMGKIVITNNTGDVYKKTYGEGLPFIIVNTKEELREKICELNNYTTPQIRELQQKTRDWVVSNHDLIPTGKRILQQLEGI